MDSTPQSRSPLRLRVPEKKVATFAGEGIRPPQTLLGEGDRPWVWNLLAGATLLLIVCIAYGNSFQSGWVLDNKYIIQLDPRNKVATWDNFNLIWTQDYWWPKGISGLYRPIVSLSYMLNWAEPYHVKPPEDPAMRELFNKARAEMPLGSGIVEWFLRWLPRGNGANPREYDQVVGFHWVNLIAHWVNVLLLYLLMLKLMKRFGVAFFTAALFAAHPVNTESVTNIIGRADLFSAFSFLACTLLYIRSTESEGWRKTPWLLLLVLCLLFGLFSKEAAIAFCAVPLLYDLTYRWLTDDFRENRWRRIGFDVLRYVVVLLPPVLIMFWARSVVFWNSTPAEEPFLDNPIRKLAWVAGGDFGTNLNNWIMGRLTACNVSTKLIWRLIWPIHLTSDYSFDQVKLFGWDLSTLEDWKAILSALFVLASVAAAIWCYKRNKAILFFIFLYWFNYGPTSNFLYNIGSIMAERFMYLPLLAFCAVLVLIVDQLIRKIHATVEFDLPNITMPWPRMVPHAILALVIVLYGARAFSRNFDWHSDVTLWESAIKVSPRSFRCYQSLAFAYYEVDAIGKIDKMISLDETGLTIVDPLPNELNSSRMYLHLGMYYGIKGETKARRNSDGTPAADDQSKPWYEKSARVLERGSEVDRAFSQVNRQRDVKRGKNADTVPDVGLAPVYSYLGVSYSRLGLAQQAFEAFRYMRHLEPQEADAYAKLASAHIALGRVEDAAVSLLQCVILDPNRMDAWQTLINIYNQINREPTPAVQVINNKPQLLLQNKMVKLHLNLAYRDFVRVFRSSERDRMADEARRVAVENYGFSKESFEELFKEPKSRPVPPTPVFHKPGTKLIDPVTQPPPAR